jgi:hemoglobin
MTSEIKINRTDLARIYSNIGGEAGLEAILKDFYKRLSNDVMIGFFFSGKDLQFIAEKQKQFLMRAMGATPSYSGKPPAQAHSNLAPILPGHFDRRIQILQQTLKDHHLSENDISTWIQFESTFRESITQKD